MAHNGVRSAVLGNGKWVEKTRKGETVMFHLEFESSTTLDNYPYPDDFSFQLP